MRTETKESNFSDDGRDVTNIFRWHKTYSISNGSVFQVGVNSSGEIKASSSTDTQEKLPGTHKRAL